jgi:hypothetical protein
MKNATAALAPQPIDTKQLLRTLLAFRKGDFSARMPYDQDGLAGKVNDALNEVLELNERLAKEFDRISRAVGKKERSISVPTLVRSVARGQRLSIRSTA